MRPMEGYEYKQKFQVKYCEADFKDELKISAALSYMEEVACGSADELGYGYAYLKPQGYTFFISGICCSFVKPIHLGDECVVKTWPLPPSYAIFGREYQIVTSLGEVLANASSRWCLMDIKTGKILSSKVLEGQDYTTYNTTKVLDDVQWKIPVFDLSEGELRFEITIANSEYDHNMHVNNTRYADYCINCFSIAELKQWRLARFQIAYMKQCKEGERLRFYRKAMEKNVYVVEGVNEQLETVVCARLHFVEE